MWQCSMLHMPMTKAGRGTACCMAEGCPAGPGPAPASITYIASVQSVRESTHCTLAYWWLRLRHTLCMLIPTSMTMVMSGKGCMQVYRSLEVRTAWEASTLCFTSRECAAEPGMLLKSPVTTIGISALAAIFSRPLTSVCTCVRKRLCQGYVIVTRQTPKNEGGQTCHLPLTLRQHLKIERTTYPLRVDTGLDSVQVNSCYQNSTFVGKANSCSFKTQQWSEAENACLVADTSPV